MVVHVISFLPYGTKNHLQSEIQPSYPFSQLDVLM